MFTRNFKNLNKSDVLQAGGKGASLGEMTQAGVPVPPGFVVLSSAFERFLEETDLNVEIDAILQKVSHEKMHTVENASEQIESLILNARMPKEISNQILDEFKKLNTKYVAVRSSATAEDSAAAAWAGQLESYLNTTEKQLLLNVKKCWASLFTPRAIFYRFEKGLHKSKISVAVVVQKMIQSQVSGIAFSVHPVTQDHNQIIIEAGFGLGEAIVSGAITPDSYVVGKHDLRIIDKNKVEQTKALVRGNAGNKWEKIKGQAQKLSDDEILELARLILRIESHYGFPCDIEWAKEKNKFYILQSRPITTLSELKKTTNQITNTSLNLNKKLMNTYEQTWQVHGYTMLSMDLGVTYPFSTTKQQLCSFVDKNWFFVFENYTGSMYYSKEEMELAGIWGKHDFLNRTWFKNYIKESRNLYNKAQKLFKTYDLKRLESLNSNSLYLLTREIGLTLSDIYAYFNTCQPQCVALLESDLQKELEKSVPKDMIRDVMLELTRPETQTLLDEEEINWLKLVSKKGGKKSPDRLFEEHSKKYGILGASDGGSYYDVNHYKKIYAESNPKEAAKTLQKKLKERASIPKVKEGLVRKYKISPYAKQLSEILAITGHERFELRLRGWMPLDYWFVNILLPTLDKQLGVNVELLRQATFLELLQFLSSGYFDVKEAEKRHNYFMVGMRNGQVFRESGNKAKEIAKEMLPKHTGSLKELSGQIAKKGLVKGTAYVLHWNQKDIVQEMEKMPKGAVLIAGQTRPQLMPAIRKSGAIVTDEGGITSHAAIVSRELGIPCVIGTKYATKTIKTGDLIEVDANTGTVRVLS